MKKMYWTVAMALVLGIGTTSTQAADGWDWAVTPYAFLPALDLDSTVAGQTVPVDMSFSDVIDTFDILAFSIRAEGWKDQWGLVLDSYWVDLDANMGPGDSVAVKIEEWYVDALAGYRWIMPTDYARPATADVTFGLRFHSLEQTINGLQAADGTQLPQLGGDDDFVDIMIGGRYLRPFSDAWLFMLRGDVGGFDLTDGTRLNYSATGAFGWEFSRGWLLDLGYRLYGIDYETGSGPSNFGLDGIEHGLFLGVTYAPRAP